MQYNILHQKSGWGAEKYLNLGISVRSQNVVKAVNAVSPDVLVLCERHDEWAGVTVSYSDTVNLSDLLGNRYAFVEDRIENGKTVNRTPIVYNTEKFRCVDSGSEKLGEEIAFETSQNKRVVSWAVLEDISKGIRIVVFATHWSSGQPQTLINTQSANMATIIQNVLAKKDYARLPVIVGGDFNTTYDNEAYQSLLSSNGLSDADESANGKSGMLTWMIDHIATSGCNTETFVRYLTDYTEQASDHTPIYCDIKIGG